MITKRILGIGLVLASITGVVGLILYDLVGLAEFSGVGPLQRNIYIAAAIMLLLGLSLIPLGDKPA